MVENYQNRVWIIEKANYRLRECSDYFAVGDSQSFSGSQDGWIFKIDAWGNIDWQKAYGGTDVETLYSLYATYDGSLAVGGLTKSFGSGQYDFWVMKLDSTGSLNQSCNIDIQSTTVVPVDSSFITTNTNFAATSPGITVSVAPFTGHKFEWNCFASLY